MDKCLSLLEQRTFNKPAFAGLILFTAAGLILTATLLGVESQEESEFKCYDDLAEKIRDHCYDTYNSQYNRGFSLSGFAFLNFSLVLSICLVYSQCVKQRVDDLCHSKTKEDIPSETASLQLQSPPSRKLFTAYVIHLLARVVSLAIFLILQWIVVYPIKFPIQFACVGANFTANFSTSTPAHHNCRNSQAEKKTWWGIAVFVVNSLFFVLSLVEGVRLIRKAVNDKTFTEDRTFLVRYLIGIQSKIPPGVQLFVTLLKRQILKDTEYITPLGPGKIKNKIKMDDTFVDLTIQTDRKLEQFSNPDRDAVLGSYARPDEGSLTLDSTELFAPNTDTQDPCTILAVGRPGIGKTSLATKILRDWAKGTANQAAKCFDFVFLLQFRWLNFENNLSLKKLLSLSPYSVNFTDEVFQHILESPENVLLVFDGLDEAKNLNTIETERQYGNSNIEEMPVGALFAKLASGKLLGGATVLTTTRSTAIPGVVENFYNHGVAKLRIVEILGFTPERVQEYVKKIAPENTKKDIWKHISSNANLLSLCYIPVNCFVMCTFFTNLLQNIRRPGAAQVAPQSSHRLPTTLTEIYRGALKRFILNHHSSYRNKNPEREEYNPDSRFRPEVEKTLKKLGKLAKKGLEEGRLIFGKKDLKKQGLTNQEVKNMVESSLLHHLPEGNSQASMYDEQYCFIHLTFQEFLAARTIANQTAEELSAFASSASTENSKMQIVLRFVAGLLRCQESSDRVDSLLKPLITNSLDPLGVVSHKLMFLLHCLFELQSAERVKKLYSTFTMGMNELKLQKMRIDDADCASLVFFLKHTTGVKLDLSYNRIGPNGCDELANLVSSGNLSVLELNMNTLIGDKGMKRISKALKKDTCKLTILAIACAGITAAGAKHVRKALKNEQCQLKELYLGRNQLTDKGAEYLGDALVNCKLEALDVTSANISAVGAKHFSNALKSQQCQLRMLYLRGNQVTDKDVKRLGNVDVIDLTRFPIHIHC